MELIEKQYLFALNVFTLLLLLRILYKVFSNCRSSLYLNELKEFIEIYSSNRSLSEAIIEI